MAAPKKRRKRGYTKKLIIILVIIGLIALIGARQFVATGDVAEIETTNVSYGAVEEKLTETGNIELLRTVDVKSKIAGTVTSILVKEGDEVYSGEELCVIDPDPTQTLSLFQKRSTLARTQISLEQSEKELERRRELAKTSLVSQKDLEDAENDYLIAVNSYNLAKQELDIMEREIETTGTGSEERIVSSKVRAPYDGYITKRYVEEGALVTSGMSSVVAGTNIFQIGDPSTKIIRANISEVDIGRVKVGDPVRIKLDAYPDTSFAGKIRHISPVGELQQGRNVVTFKTEVEIIDKDPRLQPGMSCDVDVIINSLENVAFLPIEAVYEKTEGTEEEGNVTKTRIMYVRRDGVESVKTKLGFIKTPVDPLDLYEEKVAEVGIRSETRIQILNLADTTTVVVSEAEQFYDALEERDESDGTSDDE